MSDPVGGAIPQRIVLVVQDTEADNAPPDWIKKFSNAHDQAYRCEPRGTGATRWTRANPPNFVERAHALLGRTVDTGRVYDVRATARYLRTIHPEKSLHIAGAGAAGVVAAYAALFEPEIAGVIAYEPPASHMDSGAPHFLNVLRVGDIPEIMGLLAPRPLTIVSSDEGLNRTAAVYRAAGARERLVIVPKGSVP